MALVGGSSITPTPEDVQNLRDRAGNSGVVIKYATALD
jgi:hypothetical protein